jgi:hypothetical protein
VQKAAIDRLEKQLRSTFPHAISRVRVLEYGDDSSVEPGETGVRVFVKPVSRSDVTDAGEETLQDFEQANRATIRKLPDALPRQVRWVEFLPDSPGGSEKTHGPILKVGGRRGRGGDPDDGAEDLTPVMTRLGPDDLATVDTLISAGIANSRAEVLRWALGRVREHPAYTRLQDRVHEINELKGQF